MVPTAMPTSTRQNISSGLVNTAINLYNDGGGDGDGDGVGDDVLVETKYSDEWEDPNRCAGEFKSSGLCRFSTTKGVLTILHKRLFLLG